VITGGARLAVPNASPCLGHRSVPLLRVFATAVRQEPSLRCRIRRTLGKQWLRRQMWLRFVLYWHRRRDSSHLTPLVPKFLSLRLGTLHRKSTGPSAGSWRAGGSPTDRHCRWSMDERQPRWQSIGSFCCRSAFRRFDIGCIRRARRATPDRCHLRRKPGERPFGPGTPCCGRCSIFSVGRSSRTSRGAVLRTSSPQRTGLQT
jgi:hypothetical protein